MKKVLFDATVLVDGNDMKEERRGIYFVAKNILCEMCKKEGVDVILFASGYKIAGLKRVNDELQLNKRVYRKIPAFSRFFHRIITYLRKKRMKNFQRPAIRKMNALAILLLSCFCNAIIFVMNLFYRTDKETIFFSARTAAPWFINRLKYVKKYIILYDLIPYILPEYASQRTWGWFGYLIRHLNELDYYFAISEATKRDYCLFSKKVKPSHVNVSYLAVNEGFKPNKQINQLEIIKNKYGIPADRYVMALCSLEPRKNLLRIIRTFVAFVKNNKIDDLVLVVGGGEWQNFEKYLAQNLEELSCWKKYIHHIGYIDDGDLPILYSNAKWFVFTSQYEGFGLPPLEAMQCGCPVITSNNSSLPEVVGDAGIMIDWDSDEQHIEAFEKYYYDENLRKENCRRGLERAKQFSWQKTVDAMVNVMNQDGEIHMS